MFKRGHIYSNKNANIRDLSEVEMMFMGIGGREMTDLELLKREDQDILARHLMHHHQQNYLQGTGPRGSGRPLTLKMANSSFESSKPSHGVRDAGNNVIP